MTALAYQRLEKQITAWGLTRDDVLAVIVVGSRGRTGAADGYADLDLILFTTNVANLTSNADWISYFSSPWLTHLIQPAGHDPEWFIIVEGGLKIDILVRHAAESGNIREWFKLFPYQDVLARGYRLLFDKSNTQSLLSVSRKRGLASIDYPSFQNIQANAMLSIHRAAKFVYRGELWRSQHELAGIRESLLKLYEWQALSETNGMVDTWYDGRHLETWLNRPALEILPQLFPSYNQAELINALSVMLQEFIRLSQATAELLGFPPFDQGLLSYQTWLMDFIDNGSFS